MGKTEIFNSELQNPKSDNVKAVKIMIFTEGTIIGPKSIFQHFNHAAYIPLGDSASKINDWRQYGAEIIYLTSRKKPKHIKEIADILVKGNFSPGVLYYREGKEKYKDIVESIKPEILIEDNCRSIGGKWQMSITYVKSEVKSKIKSIVVKEFQGIGHLPSDISSLLEC